MTQTASKIPPMLDRPDPADIRARGDWVSARYFKNQRDDDFILALENILAVNRDGHAILEPALDPLTDEVKGLAVIGESGDGKTAVIRRNLNLVPGICEVDEHGHGNYLYAKIDNQPTLKALAKQLLEKTGYRNISSSAKGDDLWGVFRHRVKKFGIKLIWIDEAHHVFTPGPGRDTISSLRAMKGLLQGRDAPAVILAGVPLLHEYLIQDRETSRRFFRHELMRIDATAKDYPRLKMFIDQCCVAVGLAPPTDPFYVERLLVAYSGSMGNAFFLAKQSIRHALVKQHAALDLAGTEKVYRDLELGADLNPFSDIEWPKLRTMLKERGWSP